MVLYGNTMRLNLKYPKNIKNWACGLWQHSGGPCRGLSAVCMSKWSSKFRRTGGPKCPFCLSRKLIKGVSVKAKLETSAGSVVSITSIHLPKPGPRPGRSQTSTEVGRVTKQVRLAASVRARGCWDSGLRAGAQLVICHWQKRPSGLSSSSYRCFPLSQAYSYTSGGGKSESVARFKALT
eukprot:g13978.t1